MEVWGLRRRWQLDNAGRVFETTNDTNFSQKTIRGIRAIRSQNSDAPARKIAANEKCRPDVSSLALPPP